MLIEVLVVAGGFLMLVLAADRFVTGAAAIAKNLGVKPLIIGLTIVGLGTSAPEIFISAMAALQGNPSLGIGNAIGSNIANIGMAIGITVLFVPLSVKSETMRREFPVLFAIMLLALVLLVDGRLTRIDGAILLGGLFVMIYWLVNLGLRSRKSDPIGGEYEQELSRHIPMRIAILWLVGGLVLLLVSSRVVVWGVVSIAHTFGISDLIIGLTIIAIGTSLPELVTSVVSAIKKEHDIAVGTILGSNMFNLLAVLGLPGLIQQTEVDSIVLTRDIPVMIVFTLALFAMSYGFGRTGRVSRIEGALLLLAFIAYQSNLYWGQI